MRSDLETPSTSYDERISGEGILRVGDQAIPVTSFIARRDKYDIASEWNFSAKLGTDAGGFLMFGPVARQVAFEGEAAGGRVRIPTVHPRRLRNGEELEASAPVISLGDESVDGTITRQTVMLHLWPTRLALPELGRFEETRWTGEIRASTTGKGSTVPIHRIATSVGRLRLSRHYSFEPVVVSQLEGLTRIPHASLSGPISARKRNGAIAHVADRVADEADDILRVITFLSRSHVRWSRIIIYTRTGPHDWFEYHRIRGMRSSWSSTERPTFVDPWQTPVGAFDTMVTHYRALQAKESIGAAVLYLAVAHDSRFVEARFTNAFTAFEAIMSGLAAGDGRNRTVSPAQFKKVSKHLRDSIRDYGSRNQLESSAVEAMIRKLPELQRRPIVDYAVECILARDVEWTDLWPRNSDLAEVLNLAYRRRNAFVHAGHIESPAQAGVDARRLGLLAERLIYSLLGGQREWMDRRMGEEARALAGLAV